MAIKPTIYKFRVALTDMNRDYYDSLNLTVALHPSETHLRMMARLMAFCLNASPELQFTKGLSDIEEPDIWQKTLDDQTEMWIEIGEPDVERVKKATRLSKETKVYSFNTKSDVWWKQNQGKFGYLNASVYRFNNESIEALTGLVARTMDLSVMITGTSLFVDGDKGSVEVLVEELQEK
ncbi:YaeQ family protein [Vibrio methylphosphonaticus]|uniref:YaeQ family protein n=1 Tax=Vibrio methylphosphonaticus TaxID=2946866 RepID=UPI00202AB7EA|nr:YaeQ family protein [Vibrio methylphosphonaticus]MCL9774076.1 YaeQ family protein [Vibrio methylphosphonaticus]